MLRTREERQGGGGGQTDACSRARAGSKIARVIANCAILLNKLNDLTTCARVHTHARALAPECAIQRTQLQLFQF